LIQELNMTTTSQTYANHTRWHPSFHYFVLPVLLINVIWTILQFVISPGWSHGWAIVVSLALLVLATVARTRALAAQDRVIRLEEQIRYQRILSEDVARQTQSLTIAQVVALRFAPDDEVEELVREVVEGRLKKPAEIKRAIKAWRADHLRV
jgi:hypothetical protein